MSLDAAIKLNRTLYSITCEVPCTPEAFLAYDKQRLLEIQNALQAAYNEGFEEMRTRCVFRFIRWKTVRNAIQSIKSKK